MVTVTPAATRQVSRIAWGDHAAYADPDHGWVNVKAVDTQGVIVPGAEIKIESLNRCWFFPSLAGAGGACAITRGHTVRRFS